MELGTKPPMTVSGIQATFGHTHMPPTAAMRDSMLSDADALACGEQPQENAKFDSEPPAPLGLFGQKTAKIGTSAEDIPPMLHNMQ